VWVSWSLDWVRSDLGQNAGGRNNWGQLFYAGARVTVGDHRATGFWGRAVARWSSTETILERLFCAGFVPFRFTVGNHRRTVFWELV
jgi:hypothetical protein